MKNFYSEKPAEIARAILSESRYLTLATVSDDDTPWSTPLSYFFDGKKSIFIVSSANSLHAKNLKKRPIVALSIFGQTEKMAENFGLQMFAEAKMVREEDLSSFVRAGILSQVSPIILAHDYEFYRLSLKKIFLPNPERWKNNADIRREVIL